MLSPGDALRRLKNDGLRLAFRKVFRTYVLSRQRWYVTYVDWLDDLKQPLNMDGCEVRLARPDDPFAEAFPHVRPATIATWLRPDHVFQVLRREGALAGYRCVATTASPSVRPFFRLRPHQLFVIDHFVRPELRRLGLARIMKYAMAREVVARGFSEAFGIETPTNHDVIVSNPSRNVMRMGTLVRTCHLGQIRFALTPVRTLSPELLYRQLALLRQADPGVAHVGVLFNPIAVTATAETEQVAADFAARLGARLSFLPVRDALDQPRALEEALAAGRQAGIQGLIVMCDPMLQEHRRVIVCLVERLRIPAVYDAREFVAAGGLMSCGSAPPSYADLDSAMIGWNAASAVEPQRPGQDASPVVINQKAVARLGLVVSPALAATSSWEREG
jgi:hypothetical protein